MKLIIDVVTAEDFPAGRSIQIGLASGAQTHMVYGRNEPAMIHYHQSMQAALGLSPVAGSQQAAVRAKAHNQTNQAARL
jgi:type IV secretory pathway VirB10-like protein